MSNKIHVKPRAMSDGKPMLVRHPGKNRGGKRAYFDAEGEEVDLSRPEHATYTRRALLKKDLERMTAGEVEKLHADRKAAADKAKAEAKKAAEEAEKKAAAKAAPALPAAAGNSTDESSTGSKSGKGKG